MKKVWAFIKGCFILLRRGSKLYYAWVYLLLALMRSGFSRTQTSCTAD